MTKLEFSKLFDIYGEMFTQSRREICDMFLNYDLTVSEIAIQKNISRQGVSECIKKCKDELAEIEERLNVARRIDEIKRWANEFEKENPEADLTKLRSLL